MVVKSKKPVAPVVLGYLCALAYVSVVILCVLAYFLKKPYYICIVAGIIFVLFLLSHGFSWYKQAELSKCNKFLVFEVQDIIGVLGRDKTKYHIYRVDSLEKKGSHYKLVGKIKMYEPMRKGKDLDSMKILDLTPEMVELIKSYQG